MNTPLISIIVPAYNSEKYIAHCLDTILAQTYRNIEIIIVNDGSNDGTAGIIDRYAAEHACIRAIHQENGGVTRARLNGVAHASGDYIGFVDSDDEIEPDMYELLMGNAMKYDADISHCGYAMVFPSRMDYYYNTGKLVIQKEEQGCADLLRGEFVEPALINKIYRQNLFEGLEEWIDQTIKINEDLLMNFYLFRKSGNAVYEDRCPYHYILRRNSAATSKLNENKLKDPLKVLHNLLEETSDVSKLQGIAEHRLIYQLISAATMLPGDQKELILPCRKSARKELRNRLLSVLTGDSCSLKLKIMAMWAAVWPWSYGFVHYLYAWVSGIDRKFEVK